MSPGDGERPRLCENSFRPPRRIANRRIRCDNSPETASTWLKLTHENGARAFSHIYGPIPVCKVDVLVILL